MGVVAETRMLNAADAFIRAAKECGGFDENTRGERYFGPAIVCAAFSLELYLKLLYLLTKGQPAPKVHSLDRLFCELDGKIQATCAKHHRRSENAKDLLGHLKPVAQAFEEWRYAHEYEGLGASLRAFEDIADCFKKAIKEIQPDLGSVYGEAPRGEPAVDQRT